MNEVDKLTLESWRERALHSETKCRHLRDCVEEMAREMAFMAVYRPELPPEEAREYATANWHKFVPANYGHLFKEAQ